MVEYYNGTLAAAIDHFEKAYQLSEHTNDHQLRSQGLLYLAYAHHRLGDPIRAKQYIDVAIRTCESSGYLRGLTLSHRAFGFSYYQQGEKQKGLDHFKKALTLFPVDFEWIERARVYNAMATIYHEFGDLELAERNFLEAQRFFELAANQPGILNTTVSLAEVKMSRKAFVEAEQHYLRAETLALSLEDKIGFATAREGLGNLAFAKGDFDKAIADFLKAIAIFQEMGIRAVDMQNSLGKAYSQLGKYEEARLQFLTAANVNKKSKDAIRLSENYFNIAKLNIAEGKPDSALTMAKESIDLIERQYSTLSTGNLKRSFFSSVYDRFELYISQLMSDRSGLPRIQAIILALQARERAQARSLQDAILLSGADLRVDAPADLVTKEKELKILLNAKADKLTAMLKKAGESTETDEFEKDIADLQNQLDETKAELRLRSPIYSAIKNPEPFDVGDFQANVLDEGAVLLEFSLGAEESYLWAVSKTDVTAYYLPSRERIEGRVERLRYLLAQTGLKDGETVEVYQARTAEAEAAYRTEARALSEEILGQAVDKFAGKRLIVVADGKLLYFPIGALPMPGSESDQPILLTNEVVYEPSASALKILKSERKGAKPEKDLLVFADPVFSKTDERLTGIDTTESTIATTLLSVFRSGGPLEKLPRLPASEEEATSIRDVVGAGQTTVRSGFAANREGVINSDIENYKALHFATHGVIDEKRPELSGILLSLYDEAGKAHEGGVIRLQDVYGLNLRSDLVVLSACDTGIGKEVRGEGLMSLNNAFLQAGAKTVVSSLWKVDDTATKQMMTTFYRGITGGLTASAALRQAQIAMYKDPRYSSPFHWAAFTVQGDYQRVPRFGGSSFWYLALLSLPLAVFGFYAFRRIRRRQS
ncbi:MAG: CHAT domain-containing protein [Pyrinomonadaceae bacterium]